MRKELVVDRAVIIRPVRDDDYEPWLVAMIRRGEIDPPPDEYVIEDPPHNAEKETETDNG